MVFIFMASLHWDIGWDIENSARYAVACTC